MDGKNSAGRRISLLNEDCAAPANHLPSLEPGLRSRTSSYTSSPCLSPQTPQLLRSDSTDSTAMSPPSPGTPNYDFDSQSPHSQMAPYYGGFTQEPTGYKQEPMMYSPPMMAPGFPHPQQTHIQNPYMRAPGPERQPMPPAQPRTKKNQYLCPLAAQFGCKDYFTTSGHAARHAKKHTGKKDAICPDCKKAFTRKDNMEQHRRTHATGGRQGRNAAKADDDGRVKKSKAASRPKPSPIQAHSHVASLVDPNLPISPSSSFSSAAPSVQAIGSGYMSPQYSNGMTFPPPEPFMISPTSPPTLSLDALALAASQRRE